MKEQKKNKGIVLVAESAYNSLNAQFDHVLFSTQILTFLEYFNLRIPAIVVDNFYHPKRIVAR